MFELYTGCVVYQERKITTTYVLFLVSYSWAN